MVQTNKKNAYKLFQKALTRRSESNNYKDAVEEWDITFKESGPCGKASNDDYNDVDNTYSKQKFKCICKVRIDYFYALQHKKTNEVVVTGCICGKNYALDTNIENRIKCFISRKVDKKQMKACGLYLPFEYVEYFKLFNGDYHRNAYLDITKLKQKKKTLSEKQTAFYTKLCTDMKEIYAESTRSTKSMMKFKQYLFNKIDDIEKYDNDAIKFFANKVFQKNKSLRKRLKD